MKKTARVTALLLALSMIPVVQTAAWAAPASISAASEAYQLDLKQWGVYADGTHPVETTNGLNQALQYAHDSGYKTFRVPAGTYTISKDASIQMVSNITFELDPQAVLQIESNNKPSYVLMKVGPGVKNVTLKGGTYRGDKDTHNFSSGGTHESGYGIVTSGAENVTIDGVKAINFTGDGLSIGSMGTLIQDLYANAFKSGGVDANGQLVADATKTRLEKLPITNALFGFQRTFQFINNRNVPSDAAAYSAYFYKADGTYLTSVDTASVNKPAGWGLVDIPADAAYMNVVFNMASAPSNIYMEYWMQGVSKNVTVQNSEFAFNRRQGITVGGAQNVVIQNNSIHDMNGTAPQSGIDVEAGYNLNDQIVIRGNSFFNNKAYDVILYDGRNAIVDGNVFASNSIGLAVSEPFKYATITNNQFKGARIYAYNYATFRNNTMEGGLAAFLGSNLVVDGLNVKDTLINFAASTPYGIEVSNVNAVNTGIAHSQIGVNANPIHVKNMTITGATQLDSFGGNAADGSTFDNLKVLGFKRTQIARGTYTNSVFEGSSVEINNTGTYVFDNASITANGTGFEVNSVHGVPDSVTLKNSTVTVTKDNAAIVSIQAAKKVVLDNNQLSGGNYPYSNLGAVQINSYWDRDKAYDVADLTITNNTITAKGKNVNGISTIYAGVNAPAYTVTGNTLVNAKLNLKTNDVNKDNTVK